MKSPVAVAVSGGIDSLMAAHLLRKQGLEVIGLHFVTGFESFNQTKHLPWEKLPASARTEFLKAEAEKKLYPVTRQLDIPLMVLDLQQEFERCVVNSFVSGYRSGKTPNPCLVCNPSIKFGVMLDNAKKIGASCLATGHYARLKKDSDGHCRLFKGVDKAKDQSYFLGFMNQEQLRHACFPLGGLTKAEVRRMAAENGLHGLAKKESQDVCFIKNSTYGEFLARYFTPAPGPIEDTSGKVLGQHRGLHLFTIGQRRGINCCASEPYYVIRMDTHGNRLIVGTKQELYQGRCRVESINWIQKDFSRLPDTLYTRIRYRHEATASTISHRTKHCATLLFKKPQKAVTPGQGAVFYLDDEVLGAGWIA